MALIKCRDCGHQVSTDAMACPSCGAPPVKRSQVNLGCLFSIAVMAFVGYLFLGHGGFEHAMEKLKSLIPTIPNVSALLPKVPTTVDATGATQDAESVFKARTASLLEDRWIRNWATNAKGEVQTLDGGEIQGVVRLSQHGSDYVAEYTYRYYQGRWKRLKITQKADYMVDMKVDMIMVGDTNPER